MQLTPGFGAQPSREARRTAFRIVDALKGTTSGSIRVLEDGCPNLEVGSGEEWLLFAYHWEGNFRFGAGKVIGPFFPFTGPVHSSEGATVDAVLANVRAAGR